jgi:hypothetical protein
VFQLSRIFPIKKTWHGIPELEEVAPRQKLKQLIVAKAEEYKTATPFPHVVIDGFFELEGFKIAAFASFLLSP